MPVTVTMDAETSAMLNEYNEQLKKVNEALTITENEDDRNNLLSLKNDLQQLIALTHSTSEENNQNDEDEDVNDEYALFMAEMEKEGAYKSDATQSSNQNDEDNLDNAVPSIPSHYSALEGTKCKAPHCHTWGTTVHHNALITTVLPAEEGSSNVAKVKVLFINPTHNEMLPCPYYLDTECRFSDEKCRYSHGEIVDFSKLQEYVEPDFEGLEVGATVLAKQEDKLWHRGMVRRILKDKEMCIVKLDRNKDEVEVDFVDLLPKDAHGEDGNGSEDESSGNDEAMDESAREDFINMSLLLKPSDDKLGSWEKYTKGIGSKLMEKMGYITGTGLGRHGEGRIDPVTAVALPAGKSLDHCMELREKSGGDENLFNVERKLKRQARKQEARNEKNYEREKKKVDVFNFLNDTLACKSNEDTIQLSKTQHRKEIKAESSRNLNVESLKIEQRVKEIQGELVKIRQAMQRQSGSHGALHKQLRDKYKAKEEELQHFQNKAWNIKNEQSLRSTTRKLTKF